MIFKNLKMNVWWENFFQLGLPLFSIISLVFISYLLIRKEKIRNNLFLQQVSFFNSQPPYANIFSFKTFLSILES